MIKLEPDSAFGYIVRLDGREIGLVGKLGGKWHAKTVDFNLGEHRTRKEAVAAVVDIDRT